MIKDVRRLYSNIPQDIFKEIIELDPTYKGGIIQQENIQNG